MSICTDQDLHNCTGLQVIWITNHLLQSNKTYWLVRLKCKIPGLQTLLWQFNFKTYPCICNRICYSFFCNAFQQNIWYHFTGHQQVIISGQGLPGSTRKFVYVRLLFWSWWLVGDVSDTRQNFLAVFKCCGITFLSNCFSFTDQCTKLEPVHRSKLARTA